MSQTLREVLIKVAIQMDATGGLRMPDSSAMDRAMEEAGKRAGAAYRRGMDSASGGPGQPGGGIGGMPAARGPADWTSAVPFGPANRPGNDYDVKNRLTELMGQRVMIGQTEEDLTLKRRRFNETLKETAERNQKVIDSTLQMVRGVSLLGVGLGDTTRKWLEYAAAAQGAADILGAAAKNPKLALVAGGIAAAGYGVEKVMSGYQEALAFHESGGKSAAQRNKEQFDEFNRLIASNREIRHFATGGERNREYLGLRIGMMDTRAQYGMLNPDDQIRQLESERERSQRNFMAARGLKAEGMSDDERRTREMVLQSNTLKEQEMIEGRILSIRENRLRVAQQERDAAQANVMDANGRVGAELNRVDNLRQRFGRMEPGAQSKLRSIEEKISKGGTLSLEEAKFLDSTGFGTNLRENFFGQQADKNGFEKVAGGLGDLRGRDDAIKNMRDQQRLMEQAFADTAAELEAGNEAIRNGVNKLDEVIRARAILDHQVADRFSAMEAEIRKAAADMQRKDLGGGKPNI